MTIEEAKQYILEGGKITEEQALSLANHPDKEALYEAAHQITRHFMGNKFDTCSIINAKSGNCSENCKWCAQSGHYNTVVALYPLLPAEECVHQALHNRQQGIERFGLVTSGKRLSDGEIRKLTETVRYIKQASDIKCCASLGLLNKEQLKELQNDCTIGVIYFDIDNLKRMNDTFGHEKGDAVILKAAEFIRRYLTEQASGFRIGGDEFVMLIRDCTEEKVQELVSTMRGDEKGNLSDVTAEFYCRLAIGGAFRKTAETLEETIKRADDEMYKNKHSVRKA